MTDIAKVQKWLGHANIPLCASTSPSTRSEDSPTFKVAC